MKKGDNVRIQQRNGREIEGSVVSPFRKSSARSSIDASVIRFSIRDTLGKKINVVITGEDDIEDEAEYYERIEEYKSTYSHQNKSAPYAKYTSE